MSVKYGIYIPKLLNNTVYYREIIILILENYKLIGARKYDYNGISSVISYLDLPFSKGMSREESHILDNEKLFANSSRNVILFDSENKAYVQKILFLKKIKEKYYKTLEKNKESFDKKIPQNIDEVFENVKKENAEFFL